MDIKTSHEIMEQMQRLFAELVTVAKVEALEEMRTKLFSNGGGSTVTVRRGRPRKVEGRSENKMSASTRRLRQLQGKYMGLLNRANDAEKSKARKVREAEGLEAAISMLEASGRHG